MSDNSDQSLAHRIAAEQRQLKEDQIKLEKRKQPGIGFPSAGLQRHLLVIRLDLARLADNDTSAVQNGLRQLCGLFARLDSGAQKIDVLNEEGNLESKCLPDTYDFSVTVGFGQGFFDTLHIPDTRCPRKIREMPDHQGLGDPTPYSLGQTDMIIQLGSRDDFINRWVLENALQRTDPGGENVGDPPDIVTAVQGWATIVDVHAGFQRADGRNLQGFNDGISNPRRLSDLFDSIVWTTAADESPENVDGTYMVFQKIVHDLDQWRALDVDEQQEWVGRSKGTGLLLGTLSPDEDRKLSADLRSDDPDVRQAAQAKWKPLFTEQSDPTAPLFNHVGADPTPASPYQGGGTPLPVDPVAAYQVNGIPSQVPAKCPAWAHVRKANPRAEDGRAQQTLIFRRGYPFMESGMDHKTRSGLLFICFQKDIGNGFEFIKRTWLNSPSFPVPSARPFTNAELATRRQGGRSSVAELTAIQGNPDGRRLLGLETDEAFQSALAQASKTETQQTGREGLAGPTENGVTTGGTFLASVPLGGGYYFVAPIPNRDIAQIGQQYFG